MMQYDIKTLKILLKTTKIKITWEDLLTNFISKFSVATHYLLPFFPIIKTKFYKSVYYKYQLKEFTKLYNKDPKLKEILIEHLIHLEKIYEGK